MRIALLSSLLRSAWQRWWRIKNPAGKK